MRHFLFVVVVAVAAYPLWGQPLAQEEESNQVIFLNQSGQSALVKLIGPSPLVVSVPNGESKSVSVEPGEYYFVTRYGSTPSQYSYRKSETFSVNAAPGQVARVSITLHSVAGGNFSTKSSSAGEFDAVAGQESRGGVGRTDIPTSKATSHGASSETDLTYWKEVDKTNPEELELYLKKYPDGEFADLAKTRLKKLSNQQQTESDETAHLSKEGNPSGEQPVPNLTGTVWCVSTNNRGALEEAFYFDSDGVLATKQTGSSKEARGTWTQKGKIIHVKLVYGKYGAESIGEVDWTTVPDPPLNAGHFEIQLPSWRGNFGTVRLIEGSCSTLYPE